MKKQSVSLLVILLAASGFFFSCGNILNKNVGDLKFDSLQVNETAHLFGDTAKPACNLVINFAYAASAADPALKDTLNSFFLSACFGAEYMTMAPEEAVKTYTENYVSYYRTDLEPMFQKDEQENNGEAVGGWYSYYQRIESHVELCIPVLLTYRIDYNEYTGGAHGIYTSTFLNLDLRTYTPIRLEELFKEESEEELSKLLWTQLMKDNKVSTREELEEMGYGATGDLAPTDNFYLTSTGITFHYNVYDIAPFSMGATEISLPYDAMATLMSDDFINLSIIIKTEEN